MSALPGSLVPDVVTSAQTWAIVDRHEMKLLLDRLLAAVYLGAWPKYVDRDDEWSGPGVYRLQVRLNRPEGRPLYSLKWEGAA